MQGSCKTNSEVKESKTQWKKLNCDSSAYRS